MPGPIHMPLLWLERALLAHPDAMVDISRELLDASVPADPASLARYGTSRRDHPGAPPARKDDLPWVGKGKKGRKR